MELLAVILAAFALIVAHRKQGEIDRLARRLTALERLSQAPAATVAANPVADLGPEAANPVPVAMAEDPLDVDMPSEPADERPEPRVSAWAAASAIAQGDAAQRPESKPAQPLRPAFDLERAVGVHLPVWGGAIMLLIAGFFLARMAADNGFFTPALGIVACAIGALAMLAAAFVVKWLKIANHSLIAAALASAAIGTFYATSFLSSAIFGLTTLFTGFVLTAGTAALALGIAFNFGRPVLIVGLLGGYLAPLFLFVAAPQDLVFHLYLGALLVAAAATCLRLGWPQLLVPVIAVHFGWLAVFMYLAGPAVTTLIGLLATPVVVFLLSQRWGSFEEGTPSINHLSMVLATVLLVLGVSRAEFSAIYLAGFCVLAGSAASMSLLGRGKPLEHSFTAMAGWGLLVAIWREPDAPARLLVGTVLFVILAAPLVAGLLKGRQSILLAGILAAFSAFSFVSMMVDLDGWGGVRDLPHLWAVLALGFAAAAAWAAVVFGRSAPEAALSTVRGIFSAAASTYLSLAVVALVDPGYFALAAALQVLGLSLVFRRYPLPSLLVLMRVYLAGYFVLLALAAMVATGSAAPGPFGGYLPSVAPWDAPIVALLLPALAFLSAATVLRRPSDDLVVMLDAIAVLLLAAAASILILPERLDMLPLDALVWSSLWSNPLLLIGLGAILAGRALTRRGLSGAGVAVGLSVTAVVTLLLGIQAYSFWPEWRVPGLPLLNISVTGLMLPGALALAFAWALRAPGDTVQALRWLFAIAGGFLLLTGLLVDIRHMFHPQLLQGPSGEIERYTYSAGMLVMAFAALIIGTRLDSQPLRYGSLAIMLATVGKVFLFDIGGLEGLWRVASFVGMGIALLATSWFYGRFVFGRRDKPEDDIPLDDAAATTP